jgi:hypothetical protein
VAGGGGGGGWGTPRNTFIIEYLEEYNAIRNDFMVFVVR